MVPGSVTDTVIAPGTATRSKVSTRSRALLLPTAPHTRAAVRPRTATMAAAQYPMVDGCWRIRAGDSVGRVGGGRSSVSEEVMRVLLLSPRFHLPPDPTAGQEPYAPCCPGPSSRRPDA